LPLAATFHRATGSARVTEDSALSYLDGEALLRECLQIVEETFASLRCRAPYPSPTTKVVVCITQPDGVHWVRIRVNPRHLSNDPLPEKPNPYHYPHLAETAAEIFWRMADVERQSKGL
jgi:hypothetical protein